MSYFCRINRKHKFANESAKLAHEKKCPDLPKSKFKICIYNPKHLISKDKYENHIHNLCSNKPEKIKIEKKIENIDDITKNENINKKNEWNINEEENNINNNEKKNEIKKANENNIYDEEDRIFWEAYKN